MTLFGEKSVDMVKKNYILNFVNKTVRHEFTNQEAKPFNFLYSDTQFIHKHFKLNCRLSMINIQDHILVQLCTCIKNNKFKLRIPFGYILLPNWKIKSEKNKLFSETNDNVCYTLVIICNAQITNYFYFFFILCYFLHTEFTNWSSQVTSLLHKI